MEVLSHILAYIDLIKKNFHSLEKYHQQNKMLNTMRFHFQEKSSPSSHCISIGNNLLKHEPDVILSHNTIFDEYDAEYNANLMSAIKNDNFTFLLINKELIDGQDIENEQHYGVSYQTINFTDDQFSILQNVSHELFPSLKLPQENKFIPSRFEFFGKKQPWEEIQKNPNCIIENKLFHKLDDYFGLPKAAVNVLLRPNDDKIYTSLKDLILLRIFLMCLIQQTFEETSPAREAGFGLTYKWAVNGFELHFVGFDHNIEEYIKITLQQLLNFVPNSDTFDTIKKQIEKNAINDKNSTAYDQSVITLSTLLQSISITNFDLLNLLPSITFEDANEFSKTFFKKFEFCLRMLCLGNVVEERAKNIYEFIRPLFSHTADDGLKGKFLTISKDTYDCFNFFMNIPNENNATTIAIKVSNNNCLRESLIVDFFCKMFEQRFFNEMRTSEQLGYVVKLDTTTYSDAIFVNFAVQSSDKNCLFLEERIMNFIDNYCETFLKDYSEEKFETLRKSLLVVYGKKWTNLSSEMNRYWCEIVSGRLDFTSTEGVVNLVKEITLEEVQNLYKERIQNVREDFFKVSLWIVGEKFNGESLGAITERNKISAEKHDYRKNSTKLASDSQ